MYLARAGAIEKLASQVLTREGEYLSTQEAIRRNNRFKSRNRTWIRSRESVPAASFQPVAKGSPTANWIEEAQADFRKHMQKLDIQQIEVEATGSTAGKQKVSFAGNKNVPPQTQSISNFSLEQAASAFLLKRK